jgi:DnaJ-class molecular chaperone
MDYYRILRVPDDASQAEIRRAFRRLARVYHPDVAATPGDASGFHDIRQAYDVLSDRERRRHYDRERVRPERAVRSEVEPNAFVDEVSIDFPSLATMVDRMRDAFLDAEESRSRVSAELLLSAWEAFRGVVIPIDVPVRRTCRCCGGRGEVWMDRCGACGGIGEAAGQVPVQLAVPAGVRHGARFRFSVRPPFAAPTEVEVRIAVQ